MGSFFWIKTNIQILCLVFNFGNNNMKLSKALKVKNRVAGELSSLQDIYRRENSRREDNPSKVVASDVWNQITAKRNDLVKIKTAITKANIDIYHALAEMEELKGSIH